MSVRITQMMIAVLVNLAPTTGVVRTIRSVSVAAIGSSRWHSVGQLWGQLVAPVSRQHRLANEWLLLFGSWIAGLQGKGRDPSLSVNHRFVNRQIDCCRPAQNHEH